MRTNSQTQRALTRTMPAPERSYCGSLGDEPNQKRPKAQGAAPVPVHLQLPRTLPVLYLTRGSFELVVHQHAVIRKKNTFRRGESPFVCPFESNANWLRKLSF